MRWLHDEGGRENLEAVTFLQQANSVLFSALPRALSIAEESTPGRYVTQPPTWSGLLQS